MKRVLLVMDVITPYRMFHLNALYTDLRKCDVLLEVWFLAASVSERNWSGDASGALFQYKVFCSRYFLVKQMPVFIGARAALALLAELRRIEVVVVGGTWASPFTLIALLTTRVRKISSLFWAELPPGWGKKSSGLRAFLRRIILSNASGFIVPGEISKQELNAALRLEGKLLVTMPNLVAPSNKDSKSNYIKEGVGSISKEMLSSKRVYLLTARIYEPQKGVINFLDAVIAHIGADSLLLIVGDGPDFETLSSQFPQHKYPNIKLLGWRRPEEVRLMYEIADVFILPSFYDPYPLAVVEALWGSCALLISKNCGNSTEALSYGKNGYTFDPFDREDIIRKFKLIESLTNSRIRIMGAISYDLANCNFKRETATANLTDLLSDLCNRD
jgi:glycosyltransferase involved in cell wall biosynthesis